MRSSLPSDNECSVQDAEVCGVPVEGEVGDWKWYPVAESQCLDGTSTGFGVRPGSETQGSAFRVSCAARVLRVVCFVGLKPAF